MNDVTGLFTIPRHEIEKIARSVYVEGENTFEHACGMSVGELSQFIRFLYQDEEIQRRYSAYVAAGRILEVPA